MEKMTFYEAMKPGTRRDGDVFRPDDTRYLVVDYIGGRWTTMGYAVKFSEEYLQLEGTIERKTIDVDEFFSIVCDVTLKLEGHIPGLGATLRNAIDRFKNENSNLP